MVTAVTNLVRGTHKGLPIISGAPNAFSGEYIF